MGSLFIEDGEVVGIESTRDELISWLVGGPSRRSVISVVGMGGIGKTTLAKKVYENDSVKGHFDCRVWITVSVIQHEEDTHDNDKAYLPGKKRKSSGGNIHTG